MRGMRLHRPDLSEPLLPRGDFGLTLIRGRAAGLLKHAAGLQFATDLERIGDGMARAHLIRCAAHQTWQSQPASELLWCRSKRSPILRAGFGLTCHKIMFRGVVMQA